MRILFAGDYHGNIKHAVYYVLENALVEGVNVVVQLGDFGYWEHTSNGAKFLDQLNILHSEANIPLVWIDGNHENHQLLRYKYFGEDILDLNGEQKFFYLDMDSPPTIGEVTPKEGFVKIRSHIWHAPRGLKWTWADTTFVALGGAASIDRGVREYGIDWWPEEEITLDDLTRTLEQGQAHILLSHDVPRGIDMRQIKHNLPTWSHKPSELQRAILLEAVMGLKPRYIIHGHWHVRYSKRADFGYGDVIVEGLAHDGRGPKSIMIVDVSEGKMSYV